MKKLYNGKGKKIYPSPPPSSPWDYVAALPAALLSLAAALSPEEKEVLVYLLSDGATGFAADMASGKKKPHQSGHHQRKSHPPALSCGCFGCYKSFWARWNASPNNHLIHHIIDAVEESLESQSIPSAPRRRRRRGSRGKDSGVEISPSTSSAAAEVSNPADVDGDDEGYDDNVGDEEDEEEFDRIREVAGDGGDGRSSVRRLVSFLGERVWGVWNY